MSRVIKYVVLVVALVAATATWSVSSAQSAARVAASVARTAPAAPRVSPSRPRLGQRYVVSGRLPGKVRRPVTLLVNGHRRATDHTTRLGRYRFVLRAPVHTTTLGIGVRAPRVRRLHAVSTARRLVSVVVPSSPCTRLPTGTTTWSAGSQHRFDCVLPVPAGATLRIAAGAEVRFGPAAGIEVAGSLVAAGTAERPIRLIARTARRWAGIATTGDASVDLRHALVSGAETGLDAESTVADPTGHTSVSDSRFRDGGAGVVVQSTLATTYTLKASVTRSDFTDLDRGVWISGATDPTIADNTFRRLSEEPVAVSGVLAPNAIHDNTGSDNAANVLSLRDVLIRTDGTLATGAPTVPAPGSHSARPLMPVLHGGFVIDGATITLGPGVVKTDSAITVYAGALHLTGTETVPATLTSIHDDSVGDPAGPAQTPLVGDWGGIRVEHASSAVLTHAALSYADIAVWITIGDPGSLSLTDSSIAHSQYAVLAQSGASVSVERASFIDCAHEVATQ